MKSRLQRIYRIGFLIAVAAFCVALGMMVKVKIDDTRSSLRSVLSAASAWTVESTEDLQSLAGHIASVAPPLRVTFLMDHGLVLADSEADPLSMENHANRPEVRTAVEGGVGESLRISDTQSTLVMYAAMRISPELILRLSRPLSDVLHLILIYAAGLIAIFLLLHFLERRAITRFADSMIRQLEDIRDLLDGGGEARPAVFPELQSTVHQIDYLARRLRSDLDEVNRTLNLRSNFVANASHELRSPLTSVMGFAEMLDEGMADTPEERELCTRMIRNECQRMLDVIQDILLLSRAEARQGETARVDVAPLVQEICHSLSTQAARREITLHQEGELALQASEKDLWEILYNLISNAVRYGRDGGTVRVRLSSNEIAVQDDGIGIAPEHIPHLFEQFYRVDEARGMASGGTGLGLSIVKAIVDRCGGAISVESIPGEGSCFTVRFPENPPEKP